MSFDELTNSRFFAYRDGDLFAESISVRSLAEQYGTPLYVYSREAMLEVFDGYRRGLEGIPHLICYAIKANGNIALIKQLAERGAGADLTSGGELALAQKAGVPGERIVFSGVGKTRDEIEYALNAGILMLNVESEPELEAIDQIAGEMGKKAPVAIRVNPNIDAKTHPKISTGLREHKFGVPFEECAPLYERAAAMPNIEVRGMASHIGSSLADASPLLQALNRLLGLRDDLKSKGIEISYVDVGGGLGIRYQGESPLTSHEFASELKKRIEGAGVTLVIEPGRSIMGNAAVLVCRTVYVKKTSYRTFAVVDAAMNDLARPAIYGAHHNIVPVCAKEGTLQKIDVVGPICESSDVFGKDRELPELQSGDLLAICSAGAYGYAMASYYNGRVRPAEVLVEGSEARLIRLRETYDDLWRNQVLD
ncbi:MAG: diaminopimelate decarboxylase [bacterium]|nr:diaminopimelate decarboxylase [bacterium]